MRKKNGRAKNNTIKHVQLTSPELEIRGAVLTNVIVAEELNDGRLNGGGLDFDSPVSEFELDVDCAELRKPSQLLVWLE